MCNSKCVKNRTNETVYWRRGGRRRREALHSVLVSNLRVSNSKAIEERERESWRESRPLELRFPGFRPLRNFAALVGRLRSKFSRAIIREECRYRIEMDISSIASLSDPTSNFLPVFSFARSPFCIHPSNSAPPPLQISETNATFPQSRSFPSRNFSSSHRVAGGGLSARNEFRALWLSRLLSAIIKGLGAAGFN